MEVLTKKKKAKKAKTDDGDSGVEVYFREEENDDVTKPSPVEVNINSYSLCMCKSRRRIKNVNYFWGFLQVKSSVEQTRLQVTGGFSWDAELNSLKPVFVTHDGDSSDGEDQDTTSKVRTMTILIKQNICNFKKYVF